MAKAGIRTTPLSTYQESGLWGSILGILDHFPLAKIHYHLGHRPNVAGSNGMFPGH